MFVVRRPTFIASHINERAVFYDCPQCNCVHKHGHRGGLSNRALALPRTHHGPNAYRECWIKVTDQTTRITEGEDPR